MVSKMAPTGSFGRPGFSDRNALVRPLWPLEGRDQTEQDMISPDAVNFQISLGETLLVETGPAEQAARGGVLRDAGRFQAMQAQGSEGEVAQRTDGRQRVAMA